MNTTNFQSVSDPGRPASQPDMLPSGLALVSDGRALGLVAGWFALVLPYIAELVAILRSNHLALVRRLPDDAFYYLEIAARAGRGEGFTFDGMHSTNGFHPLWQFLLVPFVGLFGSASDASIRAVLVFGLLSSLAAVLLVVRLVWRVAGPGPALFGGIVATQFALSRATQWTPSRWINGMESPVVLLAIALLATALAAADRSTTPYRVFAVGLASAALVLTRLDFAPLLLIVGGAVGLRWRSVRRVGSWFAGVIVVGLPAAAWWFATWGHLLSTSATVKATTLSNSYSERFGGRLTLEYARYLGHVSHAYLSTLDPWASLTKRSIALEILGVPEEVAWRCGLVVLALAVLGWAVLGRAALEHRRRGVSVRSTSAGWALRVAAVLVLAKAVLDIISAPLWASQWYSAPQRLAVGFVVGAGAWLGARVLIERSKPLGAVVIAFLVLLALPVNAFAWSDEVSARHTAYWQDQIDLAAVWVRGSGPDGRYGANDAGLLGYRLDGVVPVVNLDGLVNDYDFAALVGSGAPLRARLRATGVEYFVGRLDDAGLADLTSCGAVLWESPERVPYVDSLSRLTRTPVRIVDVRACNR